MLKDDEGFEGVEVETPVGTFRAGRGTRTVDADEEYRAARRTVRKRMGLYKHIWTFVSVIGLLLAIDLATGTEEFWVHWVAMIWGIVLGLHFLNVFVVDSFLGREAESRMVERELRKRQGHR